MLDDKRIDQNTEDYIKFKNMTENNNNLMNEFDSYTNPLSHIKKYYNERPCGFKIIQH